MAGGCRGTRQTRSPKIPTPTNVNKLKITPTSTLTSKHLPRKMTEKLPATRLTPQTMTVNLTQDEPKSPETDRGGLLDGATAQLKTKLVWGRASVPRSRDYPRRCAPVPGSKPNGRPSGRPAGEQPGPDGVDGYLGLNQVSSLWLRALRCAPSYVAPRRRGGGVLRFLCRSSASPVGWGRLKVWAPLAFRTPPLLAVTSSSDHHRSLR